jgi:hypothetical protein
VLRELSGLVCSAKLCALCYLCDVRGALVMGTTTQGYAFFVSSMHDALLVSNEQGSGSLGRMKIY